MEKVFRPILLFLLFGFIGGCGSGNDAITARVAPTARPKAPQISEEDGFRRAHNSLRLQKVEFKFDREAQVMRMEGSLDYLSARDKSWKSVTVKSLGSVDNDGFIILKNFEHSKTDVPRVAAKVTCLSKAKSCDAAFIDIYVYAEDVIYTEQVEYKGVPSIPKAESALPDKTSEPLAETNKGEESNEPVGELTRYVGTPLSDIVKILEVRPIKAPEKSEEEKGKVAEPPTQSGSKRQEIFANEIQAIGAVNDGRLENAIDVNAYVKKYSPTGFTISQPQRKNHYSTNELLHLLLKMGSFVIQSHPQLRLLISDISAIHGGPLGRHKSHQTGLDADLSYFFDNPQLNGSFPSAVASDKPHPQWMIEAQWNLFKTAVATNYVDRIFIHGVLKEAFCKLAREKGELLIDTRSGLAFETLKRLIPDAQHDKHFHIRAKCSTAQIRCR